MNQSINKLYENEHNKTSNKRVFSIVDSNNRIVNDRVSKSVFHELFDAMIFDSSLSLFDRMTGV